MKQAETTRPSTTPKSGSGKLVIGEKPPAKKPTGPLTYSVSKGSDVFWPGKSGRKA